MFFNITYRVVFEIFSIKFARKDIDKHTGTLIDTSSAIKGRLKQNKGCSARTNSCKLGTQLI